MLVNRGIKGLIFALFLTWMIGCSQSEPSASATDVIEVENNGVILSVSKVPQRAVTLNQHVTEVMLALGLEDHMVGTAYLDDEILPDFKEAYEKIEVIADAYPSKEVFFDLEPDFVYAGWVSGFSEESIGTQEELLEYGILPYLHESSTVIGPTINDIYTDIQNIGKIFSVEDRADDLIAQLEKQMEAVKKEIPETVEEKRVFVFDSGNTSAFTVGKNFLNELISEAGGTNIFGHLDKNWADVSWEEVVENDPEIIVIMDYGQTTVEQKKELLLNSPMLADTTAIKNEHFVVLPLSAAAEGVRMPMALETLVHGFYSELFE